MSEFKTWLNNEIETVKSERSKFLKTHDYEGVAFVSGMKKAFVMVMKKIDEIDASEEVEDDS